MDVKVSLTTACNAKCVTCPVWEQPSQHMSVEDWRVIWEKINAAPEVHKIMLNGTGDVWNHPDADEILKVILNGRRKWTVMTTNAGRMRYVPMGLSELIISFNGGTKDGYERTTGLPFDDVVANIRRLYPELGRVPNVEMHCLIWEGNEGEEQALTDLWGDFPGRIRVSYKYDNQHQDDKTIGTFRDDRRVLCEYLYKYICVYPGGDVWQCNHDFQGSNVWGNLIHDSFFDVMVHRQRMGKIDEHKRGEFCGLCERCNFNRPADPSLFPYLRG